MNEGSEHIEYSSADIGKKPKQKLITNIAKENKVKKAFLSDNTLFIISIIAAVITLVGFVTTLLFTIPNPFNPAMAETQTEEIDRLRSAVATIDEDDTGELADQIMSELISKANLANERGDTEYAFTLKLLQADLLTNNHQGSSALNNIIIPMLNENANADRAKSFELYRRAFNIARNQDNVDVMRRYLDAIIRLPDEAFPNTTDDTTRGYFEKQLKELAFHE